MNRLPIRWRLTLAFALALTAVLSAAGVFLYAQLSSDVDVAVDATSACAPTSSAPSMVQSPIPSLTTTPSEDLDRTRPS